MFQVKKFLVKEYNYTDKIILKDGKNIIEVSVSDSAGNINTEILEIFYERKKLNIAIADFNAKNVDSVTTSQVVDFLRAELVNTGGFKVVERENMRSLLSEQKFQMECTETECAIQIGKLLAVQKVIIGTCWKIW